MAVIGHLRSGVHGLGTSQPHTSHVGARGTSGSALIEGCSLYGSALGELGPENMLLPVIDASPQSVLNQCVATLTPSADIEMYHDRLNSYGTIFFPRRRI